MAAYAARAGLRQVFLPRDVKVLFAKECRLARGRDVGRRTHGRRRVATEQGAAAGHDVSRREGALPIAGKKTMAYETWEQMTDILTDHLSDGGGTIDGVVHRRVGADRLGIGTAAAAHGVSASRGCADRPRVHRQKKAAMWKRTVTRTACPARHHDFSSSAQYGTAAARALAVSDQAMVDGMLTIGACEGWRRARRAARRLPRRWLPQRRHQPHDRVVLLSTGRR